MLCANMFKALIAGQYQGFSYRSLHADTEEFKSLVQAGWMPISTLNTHMNVPTINCLCHGLQTGRTQWPLCHPSREQLT